MLPTKSSVSLTGDSMAAEQNQSFSYTQKQRAFRGIFKYAQIFQIHVTMTAFVFQYTFYFQVSFNFSGANLLKLTKGCFMWMLTSGIFIITK
jgi:hypothetical protein